MQEGGQGMIYNNQERCPELTCVQSALVTYVTAGFPTAEETPDIMLAMEAGGAGMCNEQLLSQATREQPINNIRHH
jgi:hypothetical protein